MRSWRNFGTILATILLSSGVTVGVGQWLLPDAPPAASHDNASPNGTRDAGTNLLEAPTLQEVIPSSELGNRGLAIVVANGDLGGRFVIAGQSKSSAGEDGAYSVAFGAGSGQLVLSGSLGGDVDVIAAVGGVSFFATDGECSVEFVEFEDAEPHRDAIQGWFAGAKGAGTARCAGVESLSGDQVVSLDIAFRFDQLWCGNTLQACP